MLFTVGFNLLLAASCLYALWRGGIPEQLGAAAYLVANAATSLAHLVGEFGFRVFQLEIFIIDAAFLIFLIWLAFSANRFWPSWAAAIYSTPVAIHLAKAIIPAMDWPFYALLVQVSSFIWPPLIWIATMLHRHRLKRDGSDTPWRNSSPG